MFTPILRRFYFVALKVLFGSLQGPCTDGASRDPAPTLIPHLMVSAPFQNNQEMKIACVPIHAVFQTVGLHP